MIWILNWHKINEILGKSVLNLPGVASEKISKITPKKIIFDEQKIEHQREVSFLILITLTFIYFPQSAKTP